MNHLRSIGPWWYHQALVAAVMAASLLALGAPVRAHAQAFAGSRQAPTFTDAQAARGQSAYSSSCAMCHGADLNGSGAGPSLTDAAFRAQWHDLTPAGLFAYIAGQMPITAPGSLDTQAYTDITAYILEANGFKSGSVAFSADASSQAPVVGPIRQDPIYRAVTAQNQAELDHIRPVTADMLRDPPDADWLIWRRTYAGRGYSPLHQINRSNVGKLRLAWSWALPANANETTPLVHDGVIFIKSANTVEALDGATGEMLWRYVRTYAQWMHKGRTEIVKNLAIYENKLYVPFLDGHMLAFDVKSGKVLWDHPLVTQQEAASRLPGVMDSPDAQHFLMVADGGPIVASGEVIVGLAGCSNDYKGGCFIVGLNAETGQEDWRFNTIARPGQPGGDSWNGAPVDQRFGGSVWLSGSYDPDLDLVYFGIGQTYKVTTLLTPQATKGQSNDALYTDSTVALNPRTGKLVWYYQHFPADVWDLDWAFEQTLVTLPVDGKPRNLVVTAGKIGIFDALDRADGRYVFSRDLGLQNIVTSIDPVTGRKTINPEFQPVPDQRSSFFHKGLCPYARDEPSTAFDPATGIVYIPILDDSCPDPDHTFDGKFGRLEAFNLSSGKVVWMQRHRAPEISSVLSTGGGLVFDGSMDRVFRASNALTGKVLWQVRLNNAPKSSPVTYSAAGKQYLAVVTGGAFENLPRADMTPESTPPLPSSTLWIFALP